MSAFTGRIRERDLFIPALRAAAARSNGEISTSDLIDAMIKEFEPDGEDAKLLNGRSDSRFSQIVRNIKAHKANSTSMFTRGYAVETEDGLRITDAGRAFLDTLPE